MIKFLKYFVALLNAVVIGFITFYIVESGFPKKDFWLVVSILTVSSCCLYLSLSQAIMAGKNLPSAWINRKKAEQWAQIKKFSRDENVMVAVGKFGYFITTLVLLSFIYIGISFGSLLHSSYTEEIVVNKIERTDEEAKRLFEEDKRLHEEEKRVHENKVKRYEKDGKIVGPPVFRPDFLADYDKYSNKPKDFKYKKIYGTRGFKWVDLILFALFGLYGLITLPIVFGSLFGRKEPSLIRLILERKRLKEEARTRDLNV